ncbi:aspartate carbamoyltransferase regulatory subunit [Anaerococcus tetradius]|uniref:Aspartate carbamoyltransferase regulatory chain, allosteric domain protein n=2 Tax=Anaerococcus tetradius TaxID=33036 RepID=C2CG40_9FIRM|nr:aspartate carbamoyltransferase regulatory subunit [Anaerococcus tetradius]EEI83445.1 aspartate carbamoyltransferase regulatory chain, allosteric domain protein [Anaerococcus tetradius ATCC 35098]KWZ78924.1 aspartate carbamoyltransferase regulatory chain, allosteric domain protein [Anaerococcus tetradius]
MIEITSIKEGIVIDHIKAGLGMEIFDKLNLRQLDDEVAIILNANSTQHGKKDILKIANNVDINLDVVSIIDPSATINIIKGEKVVDKLALKLPKHVKGLLHCQNPKCVSTSERAVESEFSLIDEEEKTYKCDYCGHIYDVEE